MISWGSLACVVVDVLTTMESMRVTMDVGRVDMISWAQRQ